MFTNKPHPAANPLFDLRDLKSKTRVANEALIRGLCQNAYLSADLSLCRVLGRYKMYVDTRDVVITPHLLLEGYWEMWVTEVMVDLIRPGMVVADIGANLGYFSLLMGELVGPAGKLHTFEPNPEMASRLRESLHVNGLLPRTELHQLLLADTDGEQVVFNVAQHEPGGGHITPYTSGELPPTATLLPTYRLDSRPEWKLIEFAKIDVEGAEELVWKGAEQLVAGSALKTVVMEFTRSRYGDPGGFLDRITAAGFALEVITPDRGIQPVTRDALLHGGSGPDVMLLLRR